MMQKAKIRSDAERFSRYQAIVNLLLTKDKFFKLDIYDALKDEEKAFIGKLISELIRDGYLTENGLKSKPLYSWSEKKERLDAGRWIGGRVFTATVKRSPSADRPRESLPW